MKKWIGNWIIGTAILHTVFAIVVFPNVWMELINGGIFNTVGEDTQRAAVMFFFLWGLLYFVLGFTIKALENQNIVLPKVLGFGLLINAVIAVIFLPESGYWLLIPPAIMILRQKEKSQDEQS